MTWKVKCEGADGKVSETIVHNWKEAVDLCTEFQAKGFKAWIETVDGKRVGFTVTKDPPAKG